MQKKMRQSKPDILGQPVDVDGGFFRPGKIRLKSTLYNGKADVVSPAQRWNRPIPEMIINGLVAQQNLIKTSMAGALYERRYGSASDGDYAQWLQ
jgi:hypothetical protein